MPHDQPFYGRARQRLLVYVCPLHPARCSVAGPTSTAHDSSHERGNGPELGPLDANNFGLFRQPSGQERNKTWRAGGVGGGRTLATGDDQRAGASAHRGRAYLDVQEPGTPETGVQSRGRRRRRDDTYLRYARSRCAARHRQTNKSIVRAPARKGSSHYEPSCR